MKRPPWYVPTLWWMHRGFERVQTAFDLVASTTIASFVPPKQRDGITSWVYRHHTFYLPGGDTFEDGLFDWEARALEHPGFPRAGNILVGAAGGGREIAALQTRGFEVTAFEPNDLLVTGARRAATGRVFHGSYSDFVDGARGVGPLREIADRRYDAVILGWGSLSHVTFDTERRELFRAIRTVAPQAWVLASFWPAEEHGYRGRSARIDHALRALYGKLGAPSAGDRARFTFPAGMVSDLSRDDIRSLADEANLEIVSYEPLPFNGRALMRPRT